MNCCQGPCGGGGVHEFRRPEAAILLLCVAPHALLSANCTMDGCGLETSNGDAVNGRNVPSSGRGQTAAGLKAKLKSPLVAMVHVRGCAVARRTELAKRVA